MAERRGLLIGARIASGTIATGVAVVAIVAIALLPLPRYAADPRTVTVDPAPADQSRVCPGAAMRLGDSAGESATDVFAMGGPRVEVAVADGDLERSRIASADASATSAASPEVLRVPPPASALVAGAQVQVVDQPDFLGLTAAACGEPTGTAWLVGGATTVGRSTFVLLSNPTEVASRVTLEIFGEKGPVFAPGLVGIDVPAGGQRVLSLAGFAPGLASPVVHVTARGGRVIASLQQSIVRGLDAVGVETVGSGSEPSSSLVVPGVRIVDAVGTRRASALLDWQDVGPAIRVLVPGDEDGSVTVRVVPVGVDGMGTSFVLNLRGGEVADVPLGAGLGEGDQSPDPVDGVSRGGLGDGVYTVYVDATVPVVAAVRISTAVDSGETLEGEFAPPAPSSDLAWFAAAPPLAGATLLTVPDGPSPLVSIVNPTADAVDLVLEPLGGGDAIPVTVPAAEAVSVGVAAGSYRVSGVGSLSMGVSFADAGMLASFVLAPARPVAGSVVVRTD